MYTLRQVRSNQSSIIRNTLLGQSYEYIPRDAKEDFNLAFKSVFQNCEEVPEIDKASDFSKDHVKGFIRSDYETIPLYVDYTYYVMTEGGSTFEAL